MDAKRRLKPRDYNQGKQRELISKQNYNQASDDKDVDIFVEASNLTDLDFLTVSDPMCSLKTRPCN